MKNYLYFYIIKWITDEIYGKLIIKDKFYNIIYFPKLMYFDQYKYLKDNFNTNYFELLKLTQLKIYYNFN